MSKIFIQKITILLSLIILAGSAPGFAKTKRRTIGDVLKNIKKTTRIRPTEDPFGLDKGKSKNSSAFKDMRPPVVSRIYSEEGTDYRKLEELTNQAIAHLHKILKNLRDETQRTELALRLSESYIDKYNLVSRRIQEDHLKQVELYNKGQIKRRPRLNLKPSWTYARRAMNIYKTFLKTSPKDKRADQALYFLGYGHFVFGEFKQGKKYYSQLEKRFSKSPYINDSRFSLGEYYFEREKWKTAYRFYQRINRNSPYYEFSRYRLAWCQYKSGQKSKGLATLRNLTLGKYNSNSGSSLAKEALNDLTLFYAESDRSAQNAMGYLNRLTDSQNAEQLMESLAYHYQSIGKRRSARYIFKTLIASNPSNTSNFDFQKEIVRMSASRPSLFLKELGIWLKDFGANSAWRSENKGHSKASSKTLKDMHKVAKNYVLAKHRVAQKNVAARSQRAAKKAYSFYFSHFNGSDEMRFYYSELLYDMRDYLNAARQYNEIVKRNDRQNKRSEYYERSALNSVLSYEKSLPSLKSLDARLSKTTKRIDFDDKTRTFIRLAEAHLKKFPRGKGRQQLTYRIALMYYYYNQYDEAIQRLFTFIKKYPKTRYAKYCADFILDIYNDKKDYDGLNEAAQKLLAIRGFEDSSISAKVKKIQRRSKFKKIKNLESSKDYKSAADAYANYGKKYFGSLEAAGALFNAAVSYEKAGSPLMAITNYLSFLKNSKGKRKLVSKSYKNLAILYEKIGNYKKAARFYELYAGQSQLKSAAKASFSYNAAVIQEGLRRYASAIKNYQKYIQISKDPKKFQALLRIARIKEKRKQYSSALRDYKKFVSISGSRISGPIVRAYFKLAENAERVGQANRAYRNYAVVIRKQKALRGSEGADWAAEAQFKIIQNSTYRSLKSTRIPRNSNAQQRAVRKKIALLNKLKEELKSVIAYDEPRYVVAALTLQGLALNNLVSTLLAAPLPQGLKKKDLVVYKKGVSNLVQPFKEQAINILQAAIKKGYDLKGYSQWLNTARSTLQSLTPQDRVYYEWEVLPTSFIAGAQQTQNLNSITNQLAEDPEDFNALNDLGAYHVKKKEYGLARLIFERALKKNEDSYVLRNNIGITYLLEKNEKEALRFFVKAIDSSSSDRVSIYNIGSLALKYGDSDLVFLRNVSKNTDLSYKERVAVVNNYGLYLWGKGKFREAKQVLGQLAQDQRAAITPSYNYAILLAEALNQKNEALRVIKKTLPKIKRRKMRVKLSKLQRQLR